MIKNDANKCAKQIEPMKCVTVTTTAMPTTTTEVDNHNTYSQSQNASIKLLSETDDVKPLSKIDIIKKFDSKYKNTVETTDNELARTKYDEIHKYNIEMDEMENDENIENSNSSEDFKLKKCDESDSSQLVDNNNYKLDNNESNNGNQEVVLPPKPLPRTSRNNSASSLSSEFGFIGMSSISDEIGRPIAKPRTTTSYKVLQLILFYQKKVVLCTFMILSRFVCFRVLLFCISVAPNQIREKKHFFFVHFIFIHHSHVYFDFYLLFLSLRFLFSFFFPFAPRIRMLSIDK